MQGLSRLEVRKATDLDYMALCAIKPCSLGEGPLPHRPASIAGGIVYARLRQSPSEPFRDRNGYRVADERPSQPIWCRCRPILLEALKTFGISDVGFDDASIRHEDRWRRRYTDGRTVLQSRNGIDSPAQSPRPFGPVEAVSMGRQVGRQHRNVDLIRKQHRFGIDITAGRHEEHSLSSLRKKCQRVDRPISPPISALLETADQPVHCGSLIELQHEGHVFQDDQWHATSVEQPKDVLDQARTFAVDAGRHSCLREILTGKSSGKQPGFIGKRSEFSDIGMIRHI